MILDLMAESLYSCLSNIPGPLGSITQQVELFERGSLSRIFHNLNVKIGLFQTFINCSRRWGCARRQLFLENIQLLPFRRKLQCLEVQLATCIINPYWKSTKTIWAVVCLLEFIAGNKNVKTKLKTLKVECNLSTRVTLPHFSQWQWGATGDPWLKILLCWIYESSIFKIIWWSGQNWPYYTG